jgi:hypothetical protein
VLCTLAPEGDLVAQTVDSRFASLQRSLGAPLSAAQKAFDLLDASMPDGGCALLLHALEDDPSVIDSTVQVLNGCVRRWTSDELFKPTSSGLS